MMANLMGAILTYVRLLFFRDKELGGLQEDREDESHTGSMVFYDE